MLALLGSVFLIAAPGTAPVWPAGTQTPDARAVMVKMAEYLAKSPAWSVKVLSGYDAVQPDGYKVEWNDVRTVTLSRPNRLRVESQRSDGVRTLILFDGKDVTTFDESARVFAQAAHPGNLDQAVFYFVHDLRMRLPLAIMLLRNLPEELEQRVQYIKYVEKTFTLGAPADHIAAKTPTADFQLWIAEGDRPLPMRVVITYKNERAQPQFRAQFSDWNLHIKPSDSLFVFTPPPGARKIPFAGSLSNYVPARQGSASRMKGGKQ